MQLDAVQIERFDHYRLDTPKPVVQLASGLRFIAHQHAVVEQTDQQLLQLIVRDRGRFQAAFQILRQAAIGHRIYLVSDGASVTTRITNSSMPSKYSLLVRLPVSCTSKR